MKIHRNSDGSVCAFDTAEYDMEELVLVFEPTSAEREIQILRRPNTHYTTSDVVSRGELLDSFEFLNGCLTERMTAH